jgi:phospholipase/carboxylesterase
VDFATQAAAAFDGDPARIYLLGFSQGAILSLTVALTQPELVAGILPLAGRIPPEVRPWMVAPERLAGLPVFLAHGRFDTVIPFFWAEQARDYLQSVGAALIFMEYPTGHRIPPDMLANAVSWLDASLIAPRWRPSQPIP